MAHVLYGILKKYKIDKHFIPEINEDEFDYKFDEKGLVKEVAAKSNGFAPDDTSVVRAITPSFQITRCNHRIFMLIKKGNFRLNMRDSSVYIAWLNLTRPEKVQKATLCCYYVPHNANYESFYQHLHPQERRHCDSLQFEKRIKSFLLGRFVAKKAVATLTGEEYLTNIYIQSGVFFQPIVVSDKPNIQVSITHCDEFGAALAFSEAYPLGLDIEKIDPDKRAVLESQTTMLEKERINALSFSYETGLTLLWTAKEALSKVLKTGLMTPFEILEISKIEVFDNYINCYYKNFAQYKVVSFTIGSYMYSMVYPLKTRLHFDIRHLKIHFSFLNH